MILFFVYDVKHYETDACPVRTLVTVVNDFDNAKAMAIDMDSEIDEADCDFVTGTYLSHGIYNKEGKSVDVSKKI